MMTNELKEVARRAERIYHERLKALLEPAHADEFVAIEPISGDYFLGGTLSEAAAAAIGAHPGRLTYTMRIGHAAAVHIGAGM